MVPKKIHISLAWWLVVLGCVVGGSPQLAARDVIAWGAGTNVASSPNYGQAQVPAGVTNDLEVAGGGKQSLALAANGTVLGWGDNALHQRDFSPVGASNYLAVACGVQHSLALRTNGTVAGGRR